MAVAVEDGAEQMGADRRVGHADGIPAGAAVVVGVAAVPDGFAVHVVPRPRRAVAVRVEVEVVLQLVALAVVVVGVGVVGRAAHVGRVVAEGEAVGGGVARCGRAVAVQVPAHRVQLRQRADLDQAVVVGVVVAALQRRVRAAVGERRVLRVGAEVPRRFVRVAVAVHVQLVPAGEDARRRGGALQLRRGAAAALRGDRDAARLPIPVARRRRAGAGRQAVLVLRLAAAAGHRAGGVAGDDRAHVVADEAGGAARAAVRRRRRVAGDDGRTGVRRPHQAGDVGAARHRASRPGGFDAAPERSRQRRHAAAGAAVHVGVRQAQRAHHAVRPHPREQRRPVAAAVDVQVVDGVAVAVEHRVERLLADPPQALLVAGGHAGADGIPAVAAVVPGVVRIAGAVRVRGTVAVGVEVQVLRQLVAPASPGRAAHARRGGREGGRVGAAVARGRAVAVQIPADGVQLRERRDLDQAVLVGVVVRVRPLGVGDAHAQARHGAAVAAAGGGVGDGDRFVHRVGIRGRGGGDRLRRAPVRRREGQRRAVHPHGARVGARHGHRGVRGRARREAHRVAGALAFR